MFARRASEWLLRPLFQPDVGKTNVVALDLFPSLPGELPPRDLRWVARCEVVQAVYPRPGPRTPISAPGEPGTDHQARQDRP
jgi:hypothetical protein